MIKIDEKVWKVHNKVLAHNLQINLRYIFQPNILQNY